MERGKGEETKQKMLDKTAELLRTQGYHGTGLKQILEESETPRGSLYFHFPGGKEQLAALAAADSGARMQMYLRDLIAESTDPVQALDAVFDAMQKNLVDSDWRSGCPIATLALEMAPYSEQIQEMCAETYRGWEFVFESLLQRAGMTDADAEEFATFMLSVVEGSLLLSRTHQSLQPLENARRMLTAALRHELAGKQLAAAE